MYIILNIYIILKQIFYMFFGGANPWHMEVARLRGKWELQPLACATAMWIPSCICDLHHSSQQRWILNPLSKARDRTCILTGASQICFP